MPENAAQLLEELATEAGAERHHDGDRVEYLSGGRVFGVGDGTGAVELRLMTDVAEAARRTPDTGASGLGDEWVRFGPSAWDDHARDRLEAWFRVAWRMADQR